MTTVMEQTRKNGLRDFAEERREGYIMDPRIIKVEDGFNARDFDSKENREHIESLAASIAEVGVQNPLVVRFKNDSVYLVDGECRLRATLLAIERGAEIKGVQVVSEGKGISEVDRLASQCTRNAGRNFSPMESAIICARLAKFNLSDKEIAAKTGYKVPWVQQLLRLYVVPEAVKKHVRDGRISDSAVISVIREHGEDGVAQAVDEMIRTAKEAGKDRATVAFMEPSSNSTKREAKTRNPVPLYYQRDMVRTLIDTLVAVALDTEERPALRRRIKDVLSNAGVDWKAWEKPE